MKNLREYLTSNGIETQDFTIKATATLQKAYSKADQDFYEPEILAIELTNGSVTHVIGPSSAFDDVARAVLGSGALPFQAHSLQKGSSFPVPSAVIALPLDITLRREEAAWELQDALHDDTEGSEQRFNDARWKVFCLTEEFAQAPCTRDVFDALSAEKEQLNDLGTFRAYYAACVGADQTSVVNGKIEASIRNLVEKAAEQELETAESEDEVKRVVYESFKVHPRHRALFDAVVDEKVAARTPAFT